MEQEKSSLKDRRIQNAQAVEAMMKTKGWQLYSAELEKKRNSAHYHVLALNDERWRGRLLEIDEVIGMTEDFLKQREEANFEKELERQMAEK